MTSLPPAIPTSVGEDGVKTILIIVDGLAASTAMEAMGCAFGLVDANLGHYQTIRCQLPSVSLPMYETILTGKPPVETGIYTNKNRRKSTEQSIFHVAREHGLSTGACAYSWISELYNFHPYDLKRHRMQNNVDAPIQYGMFYHKDTYPDAVLFQDAEHILAEHSPDFLLLHPMGVDNAGHCFGADSLEYKNMARGIDENLGYFALDWLKQGYQLIVTADHGFSWDRNHGGMDDNERNIPLFAFGHKAMEAVPRSGAQQTQIFNYLKSLLLSSN